MPVISLRVVAEWGWWRNVDRRPSEIDPCHGVPALPQLPENSSGGKVVSDVAVLVDAVENLHVGPETLQDILHNISISNYLFEKVTQVGLLGILL